MALARSRGAKADWSRLSVEGMISAAPTPITPRVTINALAEVMTADSADAPANTTSPVSSAPLRPNRSPNAPAGSSKAANTSA